MSGPGVYDVTLVVTDNEGATATIDGIMDANAAPDVAIAGGDPIEIGRGADFVFDASPSSDPDGDALVSYTWELLDESGATIVVSEEFTTPSFVWNSPVLVPAPPETGTGTARLTVVDDRGGDATLDRAFVVINQLPVPVITPDPIDLVNDPGFAPTFSPAGSADPDGMLLSGTWELFEEGNPVAIDSEPADLSATPAPYTFTFDDYGTYTVRLTVADDDGASDFAEETVKINRPPVAGIRDAGSLTVPVGVEIEFDASAPTYSNDPDGSDPPRELHLVLERPRRCSARVRRRPTPANVHDAGHVHGERLPH